jgi:hypothetical protein
VDPTTATDIISTTTDTLTTTVTTTNNAAEVLKTMGKLMTGPSGFGIVGLSALAIRLYTYFTCQSYIAKLVTLFCDTGTTVELKYGNSLRNLFYYEPNKMEKLIVPTADPKNINTITEVCARLKVAAKVCKKRHRTMALICMLHYPPLSPFSSSFRSNPLPSLNPTSIHTHTHTHRHIGKLQRHCLARKLRRAQAAR